MDSHPKFIVVIGASAGGLNALTQVVRQFNPEIDIAICIVLQLSKKGISDFLVHRLQKATILNCRIPSDGEEIKKGHIYIAPPNQHLLIKKNKILISRGPEENQWRPSIDVLFRSAAIAYNTAAIGVVLTGLVNDGASGIQAIKSCGGTCIVQNPNEAEYPDLPLSILNTMEVDACIPLAQMGHVITEVVDRKEVHEIEVPGQMIAEAEIAEKVATGIPVVNHLGDRSVYGCPDCGGGLWELKSNGKTDRYRCHIGHSYSEKDLIVKQAENVESTLWVALRMMEERKNLLLKEQMIMAKKIISALHQNTNEKLMTFK
ncbi:MAG TPA: chemotaxis protein CheB [Chitinophagaceae bacterium]|nr:chemotaxis protein CheB [Chitinophagaceae bacterium]